LAENRSFLGKNDQKSRGRPENARMPPRNPDRRQETLATEIDEQQREFPQKIVTF
jgi:hypothetical protein